MRARGGNLRYCTSITPVCAAGALFGTKTGAALRGSALAAAMTPASRVEISPDVSLVIPGSWDWGVPSEATLTTESCSEPGDLAPRTYDNSPQSAAGLLALQPVRAVCRRPSPRAI